MQLEVKLAALIPPPRAHLVMYHGVLALEQAPDLDAPLEERAVGGLGLHLVRQMAERLRYTRTDGRNRIELRLRGDPDSAA